MSKYLYISNPHRHLPHSTQVSLTKFQKQRIVVSPSDDASPTFSILPENRRARAMGVLPSTIFLLLTVISAVSSCPPAEQAALLSFKSSLKEPYLGIFNTWKGTDCCTNWYGVTCDPTTGRVADINLRGESEDPIFEKAGRSGYMTGSISPSVCKLDKLSSLIVADWKGISGSIPQCVTSLTSLRILDLVGNRISGGIPGDIGNLRNLDVLNLADNEISGEIPGSVTKLKNLKHLDSSNNKLTGALPSDFGSLKKLSRALLKRNQLTGPIPDSISGIYAGRFRSGLRSTTLRSRRSVSMTVSVGTR